MSPQAQTAWSESAPGIGYDPANPIPYIAPKLPEITPPPTRPQQETQQPQQSPIGPQVAGKGSGLATAAFGLDSILKGYMRGREQAQQMAAYKAKRLSDGLRYSYDSAAQNYYSLLQSGADPNSDEVKKADLAQRAAYQSLMQMQQNYINGNGSGKKKSKGGGQSSGQSGGQQEDPMELIKSNDPQEKLRGIAMLQQKMYTNIGTPANAAARQFLTPEYQAQRKLMLGDQGLAAGNQQDKIDLRTLEMADTAKMSDGERTEHAKKIRALRDRIGEVQTGYSQKEKIINKKVTPDNHQWAEYQMADGKTEWRDEGEIRGFASQMSKPGSEQAFFEQVAKESGIDVKDLSAESQLKLRQSWASSNQVGKTVGQNYIYTDKETGQIVVVPLTRTTSVAHPGVPSVNAGSGAGGGTGGQSQTPSVHQAHPNTSAASNTDGTPPAGSPSGARVIGHTLSAPQAKSQATTADTYKKMKPLFGLLDAQTQYMNEVKSDPGKASPRQDLSLVVAAVRAMNPGSVRLPQKELELEMKAGSWGDQASRWYEKASTGLLPEDQRNDLFGIVQRETTKAGESIASDWQQYMSGQPLPTDLKRFAKGGAGSGGSAPSSGQSAPLTPEQKKLLDEAFPPQ